MALCKASLERNGCVNYGRGNGQMGGTSGRRGGERQRLLFGPCQKEKPACGFVEVDPIWGPGEGISEKVKDGAI